MVKVRVKYPGLIEDRMKSGNIRYLVRVKGSPSQRITLSVTPQDEGFQKCYLAARSGVKLAPEKTSAEKATRGTVAWLAHSYIAHLGQMVKAGQASPYTLKQRKPFADELIAFKSTSGMSRQKPYAELPMMIPHDELIKFRDHFAATPGKAKNMFKFLRAMYAWAVDRAYCDSNPALAIKVVYKSAGGARPWTLDDLEQYRKVHPFGTPAHLCLTLFMFTACRIGDAIEIGRANEFKQDGQLWLGWQPNKKGSRYVEIPVLPPLKKAIRAQSVIGKSYLLTAHGKPFSSPEGLRNRLQKWCEEAGLIGRSSHGIRKAAGHLLSLHGATQYEIMSVHGHANASTSEIYTQGVERRRLAASATSKLAGLDW